MNAFRLGCIAALLFALSGAKVSGSDRVFPKPISSGLPTYPEQARSARVAGSVNLWFFVNEKGAVTQAQVVSGNPLLGDAALTIVRSWKFRPYAIPPGLRCETEFAYVLDVQAKEGEPKLTVSMRDFRRVEVASELYVQAIE